MSTQLKIADTVQRYGCPLYVLKEYDIEPETVRIIGSSLWLFSASGIRIITKTHVDVELVQFQFRAIEHIHRKYPYVSRMVRTKYADPFVITGDEIFYMIDAIPGEEPDFLHPGDLIRAVQTLARIHVAGQGFAGLGQVFFKDSSPKVWAQRFDVWRQLEARLPLQPADQVIESLQQQWYDASGDYHMQRCARDRLLVHGEFEPQHLTIDGERTWVSGFDSCAYGDPLAELADWMHQFLSPLHWEPTVCDRILQAYEHIHPIDTSAKQVLQVYLTVPQQVLQQLHADITEAEFTALAEQEAERDRWVGTLWHNTAKPSDEANEIEFDLVMDEQELKQNSPTIVYQENRLPRHAKKSVIQRKMEQKRKKKGPWVDQAFVLRPKDPSD